MVSAGEHPDITGKKCIVYTIYQDGLSTDVLDGALGNIICGGIYFLKGRLNKKPS
jgi:hypothetical protein